MKPKSIFKSRSAALGFIAILSGIVGCFSEAAAEWLGANSPYILMAMGSLGVWLRRVTDGRVTFLPEPEVDLFDDYRD